MKSCGFTQGHANQIANGRSYRDVARELKVSPRVIARLAVLHGVRSKRNGQKRSARGDAMAAMVEGGATLAATAQEFKVSPVAVLYACNTRGVASRRSPERQAV